MTTPNSHATPDTYYVPPPSIWPLVVSVALLTLAGGFVLLLNKVDAGPYVMALVSLFLLIMLFGWFGAVIRESLAGKYVRQVNNSYRWGMVRFIFSEVMFFAGFFGALFYARNLAFPMLADAQLLWPGFSAAWPTAGPGVPSVLTPVDAWGHPGDEHVDPAFIRSHRHLGALGAAEKPTDSTQTRAGADGAAWPRVHHPADS